MEKYTTHDSMKYRKEDEDDALQCTHSSMFLAMLGTLRQFLTIAPGDYFQTQIKCHCRRCYAQDPSCAPDLLPCLLFLTLAYIRHMGEIDGSGGTCAEREKRLRRYYLSDFFNNSLSQDALNIT